MDNDPLPWLILADMPRLGPVGITTLLAHFETPERILNTPPHHLKQIEGIGSRLANTIAREQDVEKAKAKLRQAKQQNMGVVTLADNTYPNHLRQIFAPPPILFYNGALSSCHGPTIAIVGSRSFTPYGKQIAGQLASELSQMGITIVSGMALGTDTHAHRGALSQNGPTAAVLGSSLDYPYPPQNLDLFQQICAHGVAISEFPPGTKPEAHNFPRRNRIISGLSLGTVVVEAGQRSGALITAQFALEQNREVFAVPGPINSGRSIGTHHLIQQGAHLVRSTQDIVTEIQRYIPHKEAYTPKPVVPENLSDKEQTVWESLSYPESVHINEIGRKLDAPSPEILQTLLTLELQGYVEQLPGLNFRRRA